MNFNWCTSFSLQQQQVQGVLWSLRLLEFTKRKVVAHEINVCGRLLFRSLLSRYWSVFIVLCSIQGIAMPWHPSIPFLLCMAITDNLSSEHTMTSNHVQRKTVYEWGRKNMRISSLFRCPCWFKWHHIVTQVKLSVFDSLVTLRTPTISCAYENLWPN